MLPGTARAQPADTPPSPTDAMQTFRAVDGWIRAWDVPAGATAAPFGASVTLRLDGAIAGRGQQSAPGPRAVPEAVTQAMAEAATRLPIERDALYDENVRAAAARMTISLELAGPLVPIAVETWESAGLELARGLDGVAARFGERTAAMFPGAMLAAAGGGMDPGRALAACVSKASDDPTLILKKPDAIAKEHGAVYYRFRTAHLAQRAPGEAPDFLHRGGRVVEARALNEAELRRWADDLAGNLMRRLWPGPEGYGLQSTYDPVSGECDAPFARPLDQALAIDALCRYAWMKSSDNGTPDAARLRADPAAACARQLYDAAWQVETGEPAPWSDPASAAMMFNALNWIVFTAPPGEPFPHEHVDRLVETVESAYSAPEGWSDAVAPSGRAVVADVMAGRFHLALDKLKPDSYAPVAEAAVRSLYREAGPEGLVGHMPWLGNAEIALGGAPDAALPGAVALREMRRLVWEHQLRTENLPFDQRDLAGGIVFTAARNPLPGAPSVRPLAFIATMLGDPRLTDDAEVPAELARLIASLRFLRQLTADDAEGWMHADPARARGGVRTSLWDQRMPVEATSLTLITVCETLGSLDLIKRRRAAPAPPP